MILLNACTYSDKDVVYMKATEKCSESYNLPENINLMYRGFLIGNGNLIDASLGLYEFELTENDISIHLDSNIFMKPIDLMNDEFAFSVDSLIKDQSYSKADTLIVYYSEGVLSQKEIDSAILKVKNITTKFDSIAKSIDAPH